MGYFLIGSLWEFFILNTNPLSDRCDANIFPSLWLVYSFSYLVWADISLKSSLALFPPSIICVLFKPIHDHRNFLLLFFLEGSFFSFLHLDFMIHQIFLYGWLRELTTKISAQLSGTLHFTLEKKFYPDFQLFSGGSFVQSKLVQ